MIKQFWQDSVTEKSYTELKRLVKKYDFVLIGGWAVFLYSKKMKSKDIDIIVSFEELSKLKKEYELNKNAQLNKYEINLGEFDVDIYLPHYSRIGFPLEEIWDYCQNIEGFIVPQIEILLLLKLFAYRDRKGSPKGDKDKIDVIGLLEAADFVWDIFRKFDKSRELENEIKEILQSVQRVRELGLGDQKMAKLRKKVLTELK